MDDLDELVGKWMTSALELREAERLINLLIVDNNRLEKELLESNEALAAMNDKFL